MRQEVFYLAYGGLRWSPADILDMPTEMRRWFVDRLERQHEAERQQYQSKS